MRRDYADLPDAAERPASVWAGLEVWQRVARRLAHELGWFAGCDAQCPAYGHCPQEETDCGSMILMAVWMEEEQR